MKADPKKEEGLKKPLLGLLPPVFNEQVARVLEHGAEKYGAWNWRENEVETMTYIHAMKRHLDAYLSNEDDDPESGLSHLAHIAASCAILMDAKVSCSLKDTRPVVILRDVVVEKDEVQT